MPFSETLRRLTSPSQERKVHPEIIQAIFGDVTPEIISQKTRGYVEFIRLKEKSGEEKLQWLNHNTTGLLDRVLVEIGAWSILAGQTVSNTREGLNHIQTESRSDEELASAFREIAPGYLDALDVVAATAPDQFSALVEMVADAYNQLLPKNSERR